MTNLVRATLFLLLLKIPFSFGQHETQVNTHTCLLEEATFMPGLGVNYGLQNKLVGGQFKFYYAWSEKFCFGPEFTQSYNSRIQSTEIGLVAHYVMDVKHFGVYPVLGVNYLYENEHTHHFKGLGGLIGFGAHRNLANFTVFLEMTSFLGEKYEQNIVFGMFYRITRFNKKLMYTRLEAKNNISCKNVQASISRMNSFLI